MYDNLGLLTFCVVVLPNIWLYMYNLICIFLIIEYSTLSMDKLFNLSFIIEV